MSKLVETVFVLIMAPSSVLLMSGQSHEVMKQVPAFSKQAQRANNCSQKHDLHILTLLLRHLAAPCADVCG